MYSILNIFKLKYQILSQMMLMKIIFKSYQRVMPKLYLQILPVGKLNEYKLFIIYF